MFNDYGLLNCSENVARYNFVADLDLRGEVPLLVTVKRRDADSPRNVGAFSGFLDEFKRPLYTVVELLNDSRPKLDAQRFAH